MAEQGKELYAIECKKITKVFGQVVANDAIDLNVSMEKSLHCLVKMVPVKQH